MQQNAFEEKLYTSTEVAEILGVSLRSIYRYLDDNKIQAEVRTATGRHRFTRQNINDFLHPSQNQVKVVKDTPEKEVSFQESLKQDRTQIKQTVVEETYEEIVEPVVNRVAKEIVETETEAVEEESVKDEPVDWLARFRQAAEKYKTQDAPDSGVVQAEETIATRKPVQQSVVEEEPEEEEPAYNFYRSGVGGLKEIAQSIDKSAKNASLDYAFTMSAGLSLHKPIKPFSLIHSYVRGADLPYFEKVLQLTPCQKDVAQLCLITSNDDKLYGKRKELHGLYVVADAQIKADLLTEGEVELANELD